MKIGILATGITPDELLSEYGSFVDMFIQLFDKANCGFQYRVFDIQDGDFPSSAGQCDGWLITGSQSCVNENTPWMLKLKQLILEIYSAKKPMVGICFGHQIIADAFGATVDKHEGGWGVGLHNYDLVGEHESIQCSFSDFTINAMHEDQVITKPVNAQVFAASAFCKYAGLIYDNRILTLQAHPEFNIAFEESCITLHKNHGVVPAVIAAAGLDSLQQKKSVSDSLKIVRLMESFLKREHTAQNDVSDSCCIVN